MKSKVKKPHEKESEIKKYLNKKTSVNDDIPTCFNISLKHFDSEQSDSFEDWQNAAFLSAALNVLTGYCKRPLREQVSKTFKIYGDFPPKDKTIYTYPKHVPEDAEWARIHIDGTHIVAGHVFGDTFFIVFLDSKHQFYISGLKHT